MTLEVDEATEKLLDIFLALDEALGDERDQLLEEYEQTYQTWVRRLAA